jgi:hypothetical protein
MVDHITPGTPTVISYQDGTLTRAQRKQLAAEVRARSRPERVDAGPVDRLPEIQGRLGGDGGTYRNTVPVRMPEHQATSYTLAAVYPFLAGPPVPAVGPVLAMDLRSGSEFCFDPWEWYELGLVGSANILVAGGYRQGKSFFVKMLVTRSILFGRQGINTSDAKGEHVRVAQQIGGDVIQLGAGGSKHRLNPLDRGPRRRDSTDLEHEAFVSTRRSTTLAAMTEMLLPKGHGLGVHEHTALEWALGAEIEGTDDHPTVGGIYRRLVDLTPGDGTGYPELYDDSRRIQHALRRLVTGDLAGMFDGASTVTLNTESPYTVFDTSEMMQRGATALGLSQLVTNSWVNSVIADKTSGRKYFVLAEEGWAEMNSVAALRAMQMRQKLSGEFGICTIMVVHEGGDFTSVGPAGSEERSLAETLVNGFANKITFRQEPGQLASTAAVLGFTPEDVEDIKSLDKGEALFKVKDRSYLLSTAAVSSDWERTWFDTDAAMHTEPATDPAAADEATPDLTPVTESVTGELDSAEPPGILLEYADETRCPECGAADQTMTFCIYCGTRMPYTKEPA